MAVHLDSDYAGHSKRNDQLQWLYSKTRQGDAICVMGDYNFHEDSEDKSFEEAGTQTIFSTKKLFCSSRVIFQYHSMLIWYYLGYADMWKVIHGSKSGNTFDRHRLDRICLTNYSAYFKPKSMQILSSLVPGCKTALSDHSGLHCKLQFT